MKNTIQSQRGFTLVEIMVVVALIGILAAVVLVGTSAARDRSRTGKATVDLEDIKLALELYRTNTGTMPPGTDHCSLCAVRPTPGGTTPADAWETSIVPLVTAAVSVTMPARDPWGRHYVYDNNFMVAGRTSPSIVCSRGADGILQTWTGLGTSGSIIQRVAQGDDICVFLKEFDDT